MVIANILITSIQHFNFIIKFYMHTLSPHDPQHPQTSIHILPYQLRGEPKLQNYKYFSEKNIRAKCVPTQSRVQNSSQPFYLKLSNIGQRQQKRGETKPELVNIQKMKDLLSHNYSSQIRNNVEQRKLSERRKIMEEKDYLSHFQKHHDFQVRKQKRMKSQYNRDLKEEITHKRMLIDNIRTQQMQLDRKRREPRSISLMHKAESFRNFYEQAYRYRQNAAREYESYMEQEKKYQDKRNKGQLMNQPQVSPVQITRQKHFQEQIKRYQQQTLKRVLQTQMAQKAQIEKSSKNTSIPLKKPSKNGYDESYHPIINPIDHKINISNKYVMKQIQQANAL